LRTPLTALNLQVQLAERATNNDDRARAFEKLRHGLRRATRLVQQLLTMARLDPDAAASPPAAIDICTLVSSVIEDLRPLAAERQIEVRSTLNSDCHVVGNEDALRILFNNLVDNAIRYTPVGGRVDAVVARVDSEVEVTVGDNGPGIPEAERERVFDRFYRGQAAPASGTGLGLAIVSQVVEMHRGAVRLGATAAGGLEVRVRLPAHATSSATTETASASVR